MKYCTCIQTQKALDVSKTLDYSQDTFYNLVSGGPLINIKLTFMTKVNIQEHMALAIKVQVQMTRATFYEAINGKASADSTVVLH